MKRAIGLIAAALFTTSVYSQNYPDQTPPGSSDYQSRQSEAGAPATSQSGVSGYEREQGVSGGNSSTGQSSGQNLGSASDQDQSLITQDSDLSITSNSTIDGSDPDSSVGTSRNPSSLNRIGGDPNSDSVFNDEEWQFHHRNMDLDVDVGGPADSESGQGSSSSSSSEANPDLRGSYLNYENQEWDTQPTFRDNFDPSVRYGTDIPASGTSDYNQSEDLDVGVGGPAGSVSDDASSFDKKHPCDEDKDSKGSSPGSSSGSATESDRKDMPQDKYHLNTGASGESAKSSHSGTGSGAPGDYGDRSSSDSSSSDRSLTPDD